MMFSIYVLARIKIVSQWEKLITMRIIICANSVYILSTFWLPRKIFRSIKSLRKLTPFQRGDVRHRETASKISLARAQNLHLNWYLKVLGARGGIFSAESPVL